MNAAQVIAVYFLRFYRFVLSPLKLAVFGPLGRCRFHPSCSNYMLQAIQIHGFWRGTAHGLSRLGRCHPWGGCGDDPVPPRAGRLQPTELGPWSELKRGCGSENCAGGEFR